MDKETKIIRDTPERAKNPLDKRMMGIFKLLKAYQKEHPTSRFIIFGVDDKGGTSLAVNFDQKGILSFLAEMVNTARINAEFHQLFITLLNNSDLFKKLLDTPEEELQ